MVIVGGGVAGLYTAYQLVQTAKKEQYAIPDIVVLEGRGMVGGRITTTRDANDGKPLFNNFGWRVGDVNTEMIALAKELGIRLIPQVTPPPSGTKEGEEEKKDDGGQCKHGPNGHVCSFTTAARETYTVPAGRAPLSDFSAASLMLGAAHADKQDRESGYAGRTAQITWPDESHGSMAYVVEGGMDQYPVQLAAALPEGMVRTNHRVTEVTYHADTTGTYTVDVMVRTGDTYAPVRMSCDRVVLAAPPVSLRRFSVAHYIQPALFAVHQRRLGHVYVRCKDGITYPDVPDRSDVPDRIYRKAPDSILQQLISGDYGKGVFQAAYACDRFERVWREVQFHGPQKVMEQVKLQLRRLDEETKMKEPPAGWDATIDEVYVRISFVHRWHIEAHVNGKTKEELALQALAPNPAQLPGLYLAGEAFSPEQGWTEGALWTGGRVAEMISKARKEGACACSISANAKVIELEKKAAADPNSTAATKLVASSGGGDDKKFMVYRGIVFDVSDWHLRHPGGAGMILGHVNEDVSELFDNFHGGWPAPLATVFGLQIGCTEYSG